MTVAGIGAVFRVRGRYSTALAKILMDNGYRPGDLSDIVAKRLNISSLDPGVDFTIKDTEKPGIVVAVGFPSAIDGVYSLFLRVFRRSFHMRPREIYSVFKSEVIDQSGRECIAKTPYGVNGVVRTDVCVPGDSFPVTLVSFNDSRSVAVLERGIIVVGRYLALYDRPVLKFSEHIKSRDRVEELSSVAERVVGEGYGVRWRSSAARAPLSDIVEEVSRLKDLYKEVRDRLKSADLLEPVYVGEKIFFTHFSLADLIRLDDVRSSVAPTAPMHHVIKTYSSSQEISDLMDSIVSVGVDRSVVLSGYKRYIVDQLINSGYISIIHIKPFSKPYHIGPGRAHPYIIGGHLAISMLRDIRGGGVYDGLDIPKERGDYALSIVVEGSRIVPHIYFGGDGLLKGIYININSPVAIVLDRFGRVNAVYDDLEVDLVVDSSGRQRVIDLDRLSGLRSSGIVSEELYSEITDLVERAGEAGEFIYSKVSEMGNVDRRDIDHEHLFGFISDLVKFLKDKGYIFELG